MRPAKDLFSSQAGSYARYRPGYPEALIDYVCSFVANRQRAWDCATGNGQAAAALADRFAQVEATDISSAQLALAKPAPNIRYSLSPAEKTTFPDNDFDLITVATAYHWLDGGAFFEEASRVGRPGCVVAAWAYHLITASDDALNRWIQHFYTAVVGSYWDAERKHVDERYRQVVFPFAPLPEKEFSLPLEWEIQQFLGYLDSWSAVQHYKDKNGLSPVEAHRNSLQSIWPQGPRSFTLPLFLRLGRVAK